MSKLAGTRVVVIVVVALTIAVVLFLSRDREAPVRHHEAPRAVAPRTPERHETHADERKAPTPVTPSPTKAPAPPAHDDDALDRVVLADGQRGIVFDARALATNAALVPLLECVLGKAALDGALGKLLRDDLERAALLDDGALVIEGALQETKAGFVEDGYALAEYGGRVDTSGHPNRDAMNAIDEKKSELMRPLFEAMQAAKGAPFSPPAIDQAAVAALQAERDRLFIEGFDAWSSQTKVAWMKQMPSGQDTPRVGFVDDEYAVVLLPELMEAPVSSASQRGFDAMARVRAPSSTSVPFDGAKGDLYGQLAPNSPLVRDFVPAGALAGIERILPRVIVHKDTLAVSIDLVLNDDATTHAVLGTLAGFRDAARGLADRSDEARALVTAIERSLSVDSDESAHRVFVDFEIPLDLLAAFFAKEGMCAPT